MPRFEKGPIHLPMPASEAPAGAPQRPRKSPLVRACWLLAGLAVFNFFEPHPFRTIKSGVRSALSHIPAPCGAHSHPHGAPVRESLPSHIDISEVAIGDIAWQACPEEIDGEKFDCGMLAAPLDYHSKKDDRKASIFTVRYKARNPANPKELAPREDVMGTILLNPGGPGGSGAAFIATKRPQEGNLTRADLFNVMTRGRYDYMSFDPRGVGRTWPNTKCYKNAADECLNDIVSTSFGLSHSLPGGEDAQYGELLAELELTGAVCAANSETNDTLRFVGTTAVARDMRLMYKAVGDKAWNYWGFSYGTVLGSTFADMFPDEVGHAVIDGVVNVTDYYRGKWRSTMVNTDESYYGFISECAAAGDECALAKGLQGKVSDDAEAEKHHKGKHDKHRHGDDRDGGRKDTDKHHKHGALAERVHDKLSGLFDRLVEQPIVVANSTHPGLLTWSMVKGAIFQALYAPIGWNALAQDLQAILDGNPVPFYEKHGLSPCSDDASGSLSGIANAAIACGDDKIRYAELPTLEDFRKFMKDHESVSRYFGGVFTQGIRCHGAWPIASTEPWQGDFIAKTKNPLLFIGNSYDPVTPHVNAEYHSRRFPGAGYVHREGYGHCSVSQKSRCIEKIVGDYFVEGKLPKYGFVCPVDTWDQPLFHSDEKRAQLRAAAASNLQDGGASFLLAHAAQDIAAFAFGGRKGLIL